MNHRKLAFILVVAVIIMFSSSVILDQQIIVKSQGPREYAVSVPSETSYEYVLFLYSFNSSNANQMSGWINNSILATVGTTVGIGVELLTPEQAYEWWVEAGSPLLKDMNLSMYLSSGNSTILTNDTPSNWTYSNTASGNGSVNMKINPNSDYVLVFETYSKLVLSGQFSFNFDLYHVYRRI